MVLENKLGITESAELAREEERISKTKALELFEKGILDTLDAGKFDSLSKIHKHLFDEIYPFAGEIRDVNLAKGNFRFAPVMYLKPALEHIDNMPQSTFEEIIEVSKKTKCYDFIQRLPKKFFTYVGEHGASLSGGERQRISLARVLIKNPDVLILDEATASLDSFSESEIMNTVNYELKNITTIIVAHRLSTIVNSDIILVIQDGKIIEKGNHQELMKLKGYYYKLFTNQFIEDKMKELNF